MIMARMPGVLTKLTTMLNRTTANDKSNNGVLGCGVFEPQLGTTHQRDDEFMMLVHSIRVPVQASTSTQNAPQYEVNTFASPRTQRLLAGSTSMAATMMASSLHRSPGDENDRTGTISAVPDLRISGQSLRLVRPLALSFLYSCSPWSAGNLQRASATLMDSALLRLARQSITARPAYEISLHF